MNLVTVHRAMAVLEPLKVKITNLPSDAPRSVRVPNFPAREDRGFHEVPLSDVVYIEQSDFREVSCLSCSFVLIFLITLFVIRQSRVNSCFTVKGEATFLRHSVYGHCVHIHCIAHCELSNFRRLRFIKKCNYFITYYLNSLNYAWFLS